MDWTARYVHSDRANLKVTVFYDYSAPNLGAVVFWESTNIVLTGKIVIKKILAFFIRNHELLLKIFIYILYKEFILSIKFLFMVPVKKCNNFFDDNFSGQDDVSWLSKNYSTEIWGWIIIKNGHFQFCSITVYVTSSTIHPT